MHRFLASFLLAAAAFAVEPADYIVTAKHVMTMDAQRRIINDGAMAIRGERILAIGTRVEIEKNYKAKKKINKPDAVIAPGLINTHTHAPMSLMRGIADDLTLQDWLEKFIFPAEVRNVSRDFCNWGTKLAAIEMLLSGTTTYTDMYYFEDVIAEATKEAGMRGVLGQTVIGFPVADAKTPAESLKFTEGFLQRYAKDPLIVPAIAPHAIYTTSDDVLKASRALANQYGAPLLIHVSETKKELDDSRAQRLGKSPVQALEALGMFSGRTIAAHGVWVDDADMAILKQRNVGVAHCPTSNMKLASGVAPIVKMLSLGINVGLGPDGPAGSNNDFNMFEEMDLASKLQKVTRMDPQALPAQQAVEMATIGGARVLGLEKEIGSLEAGKKADWIAVRLDQPHATPMYNLYSQMVFALKGSDVTDVMVNGRLVVEGRKVLTLNQAEVLRKAHEYRGKIQASLK